MKIRCSPYNPLLFLGIIGIFLFSFNHLATAQCQADISFKSVPADKASSSGKIELLLKDPQPATYTFKVYEMSGNITLIQTKESISPQKITFENLKPSTYFVKVEWGAGCYKTLGGMEGILVTEKYQGK